LGHRKSTPRFAAVAICTGGHGIEPYEQKTQQWPARGFKVAPHDRQSKQNRHASSGMTSAL